MSVEPPPPPPPQAVFALFELLKLVGLVIALGVAYLWQATFGALFKWMAGLLDFSILGQHPLRSLAHGLEAAASRVQNWFGHFSVAHEPGFTTFLTWTGRVNTSSAQEHAAVAQDAAATFAYQQQVFVPWFVRTRTHSLTTAIGNTTSTAKAAQHAAAKAQATATKVGTRANVTAKTVARAHVATIPTSIAHVNDRVGVIERWEKTAKKDLTRLKNLAKPLAFAGLVAAALTRLGLNWIRCPQNQRFGKNLCGRPAWFMDAVIAALTFAVATEGLVPFAKQVQGITNEVEGFVRGFWRVSHVGQGGDRQLGSSTLS